MERFGPYMGIVAAIVFGVAIAYTTGTVSVVRPSASSVASSSSLSLLPSVTLPNLSLPTISGKQVATSSGTVSAPPETTKTVPATRPASQPTQVAPAPAATQSSATVDQTSGNEALDASATVLRRALVNIICSAPSGSGIHSISGSGVVISPSGFILTNAHVAQYFLLTDHGVSCRLRIGSPARDAYTAELAFISPAWVRANASVLTDPAPSGTGEHDYAILAVSGALSGVSTPQVFPYIPISASPPAADAPVVIASYGAQFLQSNQIQSSLFPTIVFGSVKERQSFSAARNTVDVLALGGSAAAQEGSSGGGVAGMSGALVGTITTSTVTGSTASRFLDAITSSYVRAAYASETGKPIEQLLSEATSTAVASFASDRAALESILVSTNGL